MVFPAPAAILLWRTACGGSVGTGCKVSVGLTQYSHNSVLAWPHPGLGLLLTIYQHMECLEFERFTVFVENVATQSGDIDMRKTTAKDGMVVG